MDIETRLEELETELNILKELFQKHITELHIPKECVKEVISIKEDISDPLGVLVLKKLLKYVPLDQVLYILGDKNKIEPKLLEVLIEYKNLEQKIKKE